MNVNIVEGIEGAQQARGTAVVIDVIRAATVAAYLLSKEVRSILPVSTKEEAFGLRNIDPHIILVGEEEGIPIPGFDIGNSPSEIQTLDNLKGKKAIHRSSTGTQGMVHTTRANEIIFGSFVTASAILNHLKKTNPPEVTFVPMYSLEDQLFAEYMRDQLMGRAGLSIIEIKQKLAKQPWLLTTFLDPNNDLFPADDFHLSLTLDTFDFFPVIREGKLVRSCE